MKYISLFILFFFTINCSVNKVSNTHGFRFLETKSDNILINKTNKNDLKKLIGPPSSVSNFNDIWIYIERKTTVSQVRTLGKRKLLLNNVLILEFDNRGLLVKKEFFNKDQMNKIKMSNNETVVLSKKDTFIRSVITSLKHKINDPLGKRTIK